MSFWEEVMLGGVRDIIVDRSPHRLGELSMIQEV